MSLRNLAALEYGEFKNKCNVVDSLIHPSSVVSKNLKDIYSGIEQKDLSKINRLASFYSDLLTQMASEGINHRGRRWTKAEEVRAVELTGKELGFRCRFDLSSVIDVGDSIEIYDTEIFQVYRNLNVMAATGYSLMDILMSRWCELWKRPAAIEKQMIVRVPQFYQEPNLIHDWGIPTHFIKEVNVQNGEENARLLKIDFKKVLVLTNANDDFPYGLLVSSKAEVVDTADLAQKISFL